ncbi:MAG: hypothetical protein LZF62_380177 [Nitrospira sp.]|nr:MAG: hypothetical protein LZF62_380177 [Nitrospira sp.]
MRPGPNLFRRRPLHMPSLPATDRNSMMLSYRAALSGGAMFFLSTPRATLHFFFARKT